MNARMKLLITGTPIQNNLMELHSLFDLVKEGLLGDKSEFKDTFEKPIKRGTSKEASRRSQDMGAMASLSLQKTYAPFMLRRTKEEVMGTGGSASAQSIWQKKGYRGLATVDGHAARVVQGIPCGPSRCGKC